MPDFALIIGEALVDVVRHSNGDVFEHVGGSPANVALGLGRLDRPAHLLTWFGTDARGTAINDHLGQSGVSIVPGSNEAAATSVAQATLTEDGSATYVFDLEWKIPELNLEHPPLIVHTGSIGAVLEPGAIGVERVIRETRTSATVTYDPNLRPDLMGTPDKTRPIVENLVTLSDVVKVSDEDLAWLFPGVDPMEVAARWLATGPALIVLTLGGDGATALTNNYQIDIPANKVTVADTVGAGDSFMSTLIDGLWSADLLGAERRAALKDIPEETTRAILIRAAKVAAITVSRPGANPPTTAELAAS